LPVGGWRRRFQRRQLGNQIHESAFAFQRVADQLLVEPFGTREVEPRGPFGKEEPEELGEKLLQQSLETRIVHGSVVRGRCSVARSIPTTNDQSLTTSH
jgi:hypothetical protein